MKFYIAVITMLALAGFVCCQSETTDDDAKQVRTFINA
jgi:hypothetical protein